MIHDDIHVDYPHEPGELYDCYACEVNHYADGDVHCALRAERMTATVRPWSDDPGTWRCNCGDPIKIVDEARHFSHVSHDWNEIPRYLRGLPGSRWGLAFEQRQPVYLRTDSDMVPRPGARFAEAVCTRCGETFVPNADDIITEGPRAGDARHYMDQYGEACDGSGPVVRSGSDGLRHA